MKLSELAKDLKPYLLPWVKEAAGSVTVGTGGLSAHALNGPFHTGQLAESQAPWAVTNAIYTAHVSNANAHHSRQHDLLSASDHTLTGAALSLVGATATNTLGLIVPSANPGGTEAVLKATGGLLTLPNITLTTKVTTPHAGSPSTFNTGFTGSGYRLDDGLATAGKTTLEIDEMIVRGRMRVYELLIHQIRATNGSVFVTGVGKAKTVTGTGPYTITTETDHGFAANDLIRAQRFTGIGVYQCNMQVTSVATTLQFTATLSYGDAPAAGMEFVRLGNTTDTTRQGSIYLTADDTFAPAIDILDGVTSFAEWGAASKIKVRLGKLTSSLDANLQPSGYGLFAPNAFLSGDFLTGGGTIRMYNASGINIAQDVWGSWDNKRALQWWPDVATMTGSPSLSIYTGKTVGGFTDQQNFSYIDANPTGGKLAGLSLTAFGQGTGATASIYLEGGSQALATTPSITVTASTIDLVGTPVLSGTASAQHFYPKADVTYNLGSALLRWGTLYVNQIVAGSISGTTMNGAEWEYAGSMVIDANSTSNTIVSIVNQGAGSASLSVEGGITSGGVAVSLAGHNHNDLYYTEVESDGRYVQTATLGNYLLASGATTGATSMAQTFTTGVVAPTLYASGASAGVELDSAGRVGLAGAVDTTAQVVVNGGGNNALLLLKGGGVQYGLSVTATLTPGATTPMGIRAVPTIDVGASTTLTSVYSLNNNIQMTGGAGATVGTIYGQFVRPTLLSGWAGTITDFVGIQISQALLSGSPSGTLTNYTGISLANLASGATGTAKAIEATMVAGTNRWNLYISGTANNYINGNTGFGQTAPSYKIDVSGTLRATGNIYANSDVEVTGDVLVGAGSASLPALAGLADTNTGLYWSAADTLAISTGGVQRATISSAGMTLTTGKLIATAIDQGHILDQALVGTVPGASNWAGFAHKNMANVTDFALLHTDGGDTLLNGKTLTGLWINGAEVATVSTSRINPAGSILKDLGDYNRKWRSLHLAELRVETLVAENKIATIGGSIMVAPTTKLIADWPASAPTALWSNLVAYWPLNDPSGTRSDVRGSNHLTDTNTVGSIAGKISNAASFTKASSQRLTIADNAALSVGDIDFYMCCWIYPTLDDASSQQTIAAKAGTSGNRAWYLYIDWSTDQVKFRVFNPSDASTTVTASGTVAVNNWYYIEAWHDSVNNLIVVAVNGTTTSAAHTTGSRDETGAFQIGAANSSNHFNGYIDEFGFWKNYIPTSTERTYLYNGGAGRPYSQIALLSTVDVAHNQWQYGDWVYMQGAPGDIPQIEAMLVMSAPTTITNGYRYSVLRDQDGTGSNNWYAGDAIVNLGGAAGKGYLELTSTSTIFNHYGPTIAFYVRTDATAWNNIKPVAAMGNLRSFLDYTTDEIGTMGGNDCTLLPTTGFMGYAIDRVNGMRLFNTDLRIYASGVEALRINPTEGFRLAAGSSTQNQIEVFNGSNRIYGQWTEIANDGTTNYSRTVMECVGQPGEGSGAIEFRTKYSNDTNLVQFHITPGAFWFLGGVPINVFGSTVMMSNGVIRDVGNLGIRGASFGGGDGVIFIANAVTTPTSNPTGGGVLFVQSGALKYRGSGGTVTTIANA